MRTFSLVLVVVMSLTAGWNFWEGDAPDGAAYFPLKVGYKWTYVIKMGDGEIEGKSEVTGMEKVGDVECLVVKKEIGGTDYYAVDKEGVKLYKHGNKLYNPPQLSLKFPLKKGVEWSYTAPDGIKDNYKNEGEEEIEVPAGKIKCWKISEVGLSGSGMKMEVEMWFAKDIGMVKFSAKFGGLDEIVMELKSFSKGEGEKGNEEKK